MEGIDVIKVLFMYCGWGFLCVILGNPYKNLFLFSENKRKLFHINTFLFQAADLKYCFH